MSKTIDNLAQQFELTHDAENKLKNDRHEIEKKIIETVGVRVEGATTEKTSLFKVTTTGKTTRKVMANQLECFLLRTLIGKDEFYKIFRVKISLNEKYFKEIRDNNPDLYNAVIPYITETPAKTGVKVERLEGVA